MPVAIVDERTSVEYVVVGEAQPGVPDLILLHGTGGTARSNWGHLWDGLRSGRRVIAPNFAGSGATTDHGGRLELHELVAQAAAAAEHAGSTHYDVVGFSLGAVVAAQLAAVHPERVHRLVMLAGWASSDDPRFHLQFELWLQLYLTDREALARLLTLTGFSPAYLSKRPAAAVQRVVDETLATLPPGIGRQSELDQRVDIRASLELITAFTLVIGCRDDQMVPVNHARELVAPIRWSDYTELEGGHLAIYEQPAALTEAVTAFLDRPDRRRVGAPFEGDERREYR